MRSFKLFFASIIILALNFAIAQGAVQQRKKSAPKPAPSKASSTAVINVQVRFVNGQEVSGRLIDISPKRISIDPGNGTVVVSALQEVERLTIGSALPKPISKPKLSLDFLKDADEALAALLALSLATDGNISFTEYEPKVNEVKIVIGKFTAKYSTAEQSELINYMRNSVRAFEMALPIWSLRLGAEQHKYVVQSSRQMQPIIEAFPDIIDVSWKNNDRYPVEKVIAWLWVKGATLVEQSKKQMQQLKQ